MTVPMDSSFDPLTRERAQLLYNKNVELESMLRRLAQARVPSDPNIWNQMRENYEAIILEDHAFAEQHEVEYALWQLHYRRIEELRAHFSAALSSSSAAPQDGKVSSRPDRISKIRSQFKTFLSEATGFYHDLMLKIRAKYGLPLGYFSDEPENQIVTSKEGAKSAELKKGLISCHRCLIYLGDLSRYKGLYGEGDSKARDFAAASSYYMQASSFWPASGNPHHQLAILASYSGDEVVAIYRYFRSLAVENPFSTARENLIIAFEKNRQSFTQLHADAKASPVKNVHARPGKGRGRGAVPPVKDNKLEAKPVKESISSKAETLRALSIRFVRLNGILFTRTSLETFEDVLSSVKSDLLELLSSGPEEEYNFASEPGDNGLIIVRLVAILIFTIHNVNRETENQSYAEILQRSVLLENAYAAVFEIMGHFCEKCVQLRDPSSSFLLPGVLVFVEWLACHLEIAAGSEVEEKQAAARLYFWTTCISLLNKLMSSGFAAGTEDGDESCFFNTSRYDECETGNRLALWEDLELRGFLPLLPAHQILDFSRKHSVGSDSGSKEKKSRVQRIISAGKALTSVVRIGQEVIYFNSGSNKFALGVSPQIYSDSALHGSSGIREANESQQVHMPVNKTNGGLLQEEGEEEDEVIVFRPSVADKCADIMVPKVMSREDAGPGSNAVEGVSTVNGDLGSAVGSSSLSLNVGFMPNVYDPSFGPPPYITPSIVPQQLQSMQPSSSKWLGQQQTSLINGLNNLIFRENGHVAKPGLPQHGGVLQPAMLPVSGAQTAPVSLSNECSAQILDTVVPSKFDSVMSLGANSGSLAVKSSSGLPVNSRKNPVSRPVRHLGPPPGFCPFPPKTSVEPFSGVTLKNDSRQMDDYGWLDKYELSSVIGTGYNNYVNHSAKTHVANKNTYSNVAMSFPFPGKQAPIRQVPVENQKNCQNYNFPDRFNLYQEQLQQVQKANQQSISMPEQHNGQSLWESHFLV